MTTSHDTPPPTDDNPFAWDELTLEILASTSAKMYDEFYDFLAHYQFDFSPDEKAWALAQIMSDITKANQAADEGDFE